MIISNGGDKELYGSWFKEDLLEFLGGVNKLLLIPYAQFDYDKPLNTLKERLGVIGLEVDTIENYKNKIEAIENADAFIVCGGNTFHLLSKLYEFKLIEPLKVKINSGTPYAGFSAGANIVTPNIRTTNDMPVVEVPTLNALNIVPFNINPHYFDPIPGVPGETKVQRINEFHKVNDNVVLGIKEYTYLKVIGDTMTLHGKESMKVFENGIEPYDVEANSEVSKFLIKNG